MGAKRPMDIYVRVTVEDVEKGRISFTNNMGQRVEIDLSEIKEAMENEST